MKNKVELQAATKIYRSKAGSSGGVRGIDLKVRENEFVAVCGRSGSGKTTILSVLGLLERLDEGKYFFDGAEIGNVSATKAARLRASKLGFVFQSFNLIEHLTVLQNVSLPAEFLGMNSRLAHSKAMALLELLDMQQLAERRPSELSGGQRQLAAISRSLINDPPLILADEPTGNLDSVTAEKIVSTLSELRQKNGKTVVMVTHDLGLAARADRIIKIFDGKLI